MVTKNIDDSIKELSQECHFCRNKEDSDFKICNQCVLIFTEELDNIEHIKDDIITQKLSLKKITDLIERKKKEYDKLWRKTSTLQDYNIYCQMKPIYDKEIDKARNESVTLENKNYDLAGKIMENESKLRRYSSLSKSTQVFIKLKTKGKRHVNYCCDCGKLIKKGETIRYYQSGNNWVYQHLSCFLKFVVKNQYPLFVVKEKRTNYYQHIITDYLFDKKK